jgi:hypothetical protein
VESAETPDICISSRPLALRVQYASEACLQLQSSDHWIVRGHFARADRRWLLAT